MNVRPVKFLIVLMAIFFIQRANGQQVLQYLSVQQQIAPPLRATDSTTRSHPLLHIDKNFYVKNLGGMCLGEWRFEKRSGVPLRLRLGSLEQCNYLEQKNR